MLETICSRTISSLYPLPAVLLATSNNRRRACPVLTGLLLLCRASYRQGAILQSLLRRPPLNAVINPSTLSVCQHIKKKYATPVDRPAWRARVERTSDCALRGAPRPRGADRWLRQTYIAEPALPLCWTINLLFGFQICLHFCFPLLCPYACVCKNDYTA